MSTIYDGSASNCFECAAKKGEHHDEGCPSDPWRALANDASSSAANRISPEFALQFIVKEKEKDEPNDSWNNYDWNKPSLAVIACDGKGHGCVLFTAGPHVKFDIEEIGTNRLDDHGLDDAPLGLSVWEGVLAAEGSKWAGDQENYLKGTFRKLSELEWLAVQENRVPWDDELWKLDRKPPNLAG